MSQLDNFQHGRSYQDCLSLLPNRGFGGAEVANSGVHARSDKEFFIDGPLAVGAHEAAEWFRDKLGGSPDSTKRFFLFLVGAPGNGKSHIASSLQQELKPISKKNKKKHYRKHEYTSSSNQKVVVINDATIPAVNAKGEVIANSLISDIDLALAENQLLLVNVNRGILYEELQADQSSSFARDVVCWLSETQDPDSGANFTRGASNEKDDSALRSHTVIDPGTGAEVHLLAVHVDRYSMLEASPAVDGFGQTDSGFPKTVSPYRVKRLKHRDNSFCSGTTVGQLLGKFFSEEHFPLPSDSGNALVDPFAANVENFRTEEFRSGFQNILRSAELVSSHKLTYRELWGAVVTSVVGFENDPQMWLHENQPPVEMGKAKLKAFMMLASCRAHQSLFGAARVGVETDPQFVRTPITVLTGKIDPAFDAIPGISDSRNSGWAGFVLDAFQAQSEGDSILRALKELLEESQDTAAKSITKFDLQLDEVITQAIDGATRWLKDNEKQFVVAWYGEYLVRLYALARGIPAYRNELSKFLDVRVEAQNSSALEATAASALRTLLLPFYSQDPDNRSVLLPLFDGRTEPVVERTERPKLVLKPHDRIDFLVATRGDALTVELKCDGMSVGKVPLDFALFREAMACVGNHAGYTDLADSLTPRIERFRSSMLHEKPIAGYFAVNGPQLIKIVQD